MLSLPIGIIILVGVMVYALSGTQAATLVNMHSLTLVGVGTVGVLWLSVPSGEIINLFKSLLELLKSVPSQRTLDTELIALSKNRDSKLPHPHALVTYAQGLWEQGLDEDLFVLMVSQRLRELNGTSEQSVASLRNLAKYPPALGMTGTVIGLVSLFSSLTPESRSQIGPNLALALTATFYGLILANVILMPLSDRLHVRHLKRAKDNEHIYRVVLMINSGEPQQVIAGGLHDTAA
ncbi:MotA/TolQ/ExbB proton channel family protein [Bdellovibrionota bacterium FG-1]